MIVLITVSMLRNIFTLELILFFPSPECKRYQIRCNNGIGCYYSWERCDGDPDCIDNSDESFCSKALLIFIMIIIIVIIC